ncbi:hypothetical protein ACFZAC_22020 [Pseudomonas fluorescens]|uniref:hypothetical protein n=1 Tax=Pseudomonas fluorescens TaxID=294 RepID=UPI0037493B28
MSGEIDWGPLVQSLAAINWTAILTPVIPGAVAIFVPISLWQRQVKRESDSVKAGLLAEVAALVEILERRAFLPALRDKEKALAFQGDSAMREFRNTLESFEVIIDSQFNRVYQANLAKLGALTADEAKQIVRFHMLVDSVRIDVSPGGGLAIGTNSADEFKETADLLEMALAIGHSLADPSIPPASK